MIFYFDNIGFNNNDRKTCEGIDIPIKIIKFNKELFSSFIYQHFNYCISIGEFPNELKQADVIPAYKRLNVIKLTIDKLVYLTFQKFMRNLFIINFMNTLVINNFLVNVNFIRGIVLNKVFWL